MQITIAIPTIAGRAKYLAHALATCVAEPDSNLTILVSDNSPGDAEATVRSFDDPRIRYVRPPHFLPMSAHWEFLLGNVDSDVLCIIGDDDAVMPGGIAAATRLLAIHGNVPIHHSLANYFWPDNPRVMRRNQVVFYHDIGPDRWLDSVTYLRQVAAGNLRYSDGPAVYHNFIPMPLIRRIAGDGAFFRRAIPDVYSAFAIAANTERFFSAGQLLTLSGTGARSNSAAVDTSGPDSAAFFKISAEHPLYKARFAARTVPLLQIDSLIEVSQHFNRPEILADIDYVQQLEAMILEVMPIVGKEDRRREYRAAFDVAWANGASLPLSIRLARRGLEKIARRLGLPVRYRSMAAQAGGTMLTLPVEVTNVAQAAQALSTFIADGTLPQPLAP